MVSPVEWGAGGEEQQLTGGAGQDGNQCHRQDMGTVASPGHSYSLAIAGHHWLSVVSVLAATEIVLEPKVYKKESIKMHPDFRPGSLILYRQQCCTLHTKPVFTNCSFLISTPT